MPTHYLISYDIANPKRLRRVERCCSDAGDRVQESVFLCELSAAELLGLQRRLLKLIDPAADSIRYSPLCARDYHTALQQGLDSLPKPVAGWIV